MIIKSLHIEAQQKIIDMKKSDIQLENKLGFKLAILNEHRSNNQTSAQETVMDKAKNRDELLQMLTFNPQAIMTSDQFITAVGDYDSEDTDANNVAVPELVSPANLTAAPKHGKIVLFWDSVNAATGYHVKRSTKTGGPYTKIANLGVVNSYTDINVETGIAYYYVVTSVNEYTESDHSNEACAAI